MMQQLAQGPGRCSRPVACPPRSLGRPARALAARARRSTLVVVVRASGSNAGEGAAGGEGELEEASSSSSPPTRSVATKRAYTSLQSKPPIGAEYGEGFVHFGYGTEPRRLDVDTLNERLKHSGAVRLRHTLKPDEAYGSIFNFDTVVADTEGAYRRAWVELATHRGLPLPSHVRLQMQQTCPERIIMDVLNWTRSMKEARAMAWDLAEAYAKQLETLSEPQGGVVEWLNALTNFNIPCALVSTLDKAAVRRALERMHLHDHFHTMVTAEDDMESMAQRLLSASLQLQRPPNLCVVFDACPEGVTAAHNCTMKAVAVAGRYPVYKLRGADLTCTDLSELAVYNMRRLFSASGDEFMDLRTQQDGGKPKSKRRITNALLPS